VLTMFGIHGPPATSRSRRSLLPGSGAGAGRRGGLPSIGRGPGSEPKAVASPDLPAAR
jgi:hypothetical protein